MDILIVDKEYPVVNIEVVVEDKYCLTTETSNDNSKLEEHIYIPNINFNFSYTYSNTSYVEEMQNYFPACLAYDTCQKEHRYSKLLDTH